MKLFRKKMISVLLVCLFILRRFCKDNYAVYISK